MSGEAGLGRVYLGTTGVRVSPISLGTWRFGGSPAGTPDITESDAYGLLDAYADAGGNFIDTADRYGKGRSEEWIGNWLEDRDRDSFVIASKTGRPTLDREDASRPFLRRQLDAMLDRLGTDYLDILYLHRWDDDTVTEDVMRTLDEFVAEGRVHHLGISSNPPDAWKVARAIEVAVRNGYEPFTVAQPRYNLVKRAVESNYLDMARAYGLAICPYSPLGEGFLTGKYERDGNLPTDSRAAREERVESWYFSPEAFDLLEVVRSIADEVGATPTQVSLAWLLHHPDVTAPIVGARTVNQLSENLAACDVSLSPSQFERLDETLAPSLDQ